MKEKTKFRFTIRKKVFLLTAALSVALIVVSVAIASTIFSVRVKSDAKELCATSAELLGDYLANYDMVVSTSGSVTSFLTYYIEQIDPVYRENRDEIERMSAMELTSEEDFGAKTTYFKDLTTSVFGSETGFGMSYTLLSFKKAYAEVNEEMERMAALDGVLKCEVCYYDPERNNLVFLCDSSSEKQWGHLFAGSVEKAPADFVKDVYPNDRTAVVVVEDEFASYAPVRVGGKTVAYVSFDYSIDSLVESQRGFLWTLVGIMLLSTVVILLLYLLLANKWLVKNVTKLSEAARTFTSHMDGEEIRPVSADIRTSDEIGDLSEDFFALQNKVVVYSDDIARKRAEEERMQAELTIASKIQMQSLPDRPLATETARVSSFIKPAKEVGGDLFDYFLTDEGKLFFVIADVSGKGVPAGLFMMRGKEIIRSLAKAGMNPGIIAKTANEELCKNNKEGLFITAFIGLYDDKEKKLTFARAGHEQPYLLRNGKAEKFGEESNFVLGAFADMPFEEDSLDVLDGDRILFYTDGLNEGINASDEEFGYESIQETLEHTDGDLLQALYEKAVLFADGVEQFDDITMLLFECVKSKSFLLKAPTFDDIPKVTDEINEFVRGYDSDKISELDVIIDEVMTNEISYAFDNVKKPLLEIEALLRKGIAQLTFVDNGMLFNPLTAKEPDVESDLIDRPEGGMGIMLVKTMADSISYRTEKGKNHLRINKVLI